jgi:acetylornithine deacetylase
VDPVSLVGDTCRLIDIDSTTGREAEAGVVLAGWLAGRGWNVRHQPVDATRFNVVATTGPSAPRVTLSTHYDCVPPYFPSRVEGDRVYGRGSCDAKGILVAQVAAAELLRARGRDDVALLFVVGEERGSDGAAAANAGALPSAFLVNGEPTDNRLALATRGVLRVVLRASGRAAHSSYPELGESAIEKLLDALVAMRAIELPADPVLGRTHYTAGVIQGGVAPNVVPPSASAEVLFRIVGPPQDVRGLLVSRLSAIGVEVEDVLEIGPVRFHTVAGIETAVFPYTTDAPLLSKWGRPLLYGPGSILAAHTDHEHVTVAALERAVDDYVRIVEQLAP